MRKLSEWTEKNAGKVWFACLVNGIFLAALLVLLRPCFETNDDISIAMIANGGRGARSAYVICQNYLLGMVYRAIYALGHGRIPWYTLLQYAVLFASLTTVTHVLLLHLKTDQAFLASGILLLYFGKECYVSMQYTKTAGIAAAAGIFWMYYVLLGERRNPADERGTRPRRLALLWGIFLAVVGSLYRFEEAAVCTALLTGPGVYFLLELKSLPKGEGKAKLLSCLCAFGIAACLMAGLEVFDHKMYEADPEWDTYMKYNECRSNLSDYTFPRWEDHKEEYQELGIRKTAYRIFRKGLNFYDPEVFPLEVLEKMDAMRPRNTLSKALAGQFLRKYPVGYLEIPVFLGFVILAFLWLFWKKRGWRSWVTAGYEVAVMGAIDFYLFYEGRYLENRVETGLWFAISLVVVWLYEAGKTQISKKTALLGLACLTIACQGTWKERWRSLTEQEEQDRAYIRESFLEAVSVDTEGLYLSKLGGITYTSYGMLYRVPEGVFENVVWYGGWEMGNPLWNAKMKEYGVTNPYKDVIDQEHVYIVDDDIDLTLSYIRDYYQKNVEAELVKEAGYLKVYRIRTGKQA